MASEPPSVPDAVFPVALAGERLIIRELVPSDAVPVIEISAIPRFYGS